MTTLIRLSMLSMMATLALPSATLSQTKMSQFCVGPKIAGADRPRMARVKEPQRVGTLCRAKDFQTNEDMVGRIVEDSTSEAAAPPPRRSPAKEEKTLGDEE
jgi:hypothetical protein